MKSHRFRRALLGCAWCALTLFAERAANPADAPTPTPRPNDRTLADVARRINLDRSLLADKDGQICVDSEFLAAIAKHGRLTIPPTSASGGAQASPTPIPPAVRGRWRKAVQRQREVVERLERRRARLVVEIENLERARLTARILARLENAESELDLLDNDLRREKSELRRLIREARQHGAEPGWFR